ncbi:MAG: gamma-glutamyl-gamma-aminobutyrate hydrolase family protein [Lachnospiraceae bacterium]|nr:gamma-glutamyl-gamma-aminobutyrate hydrolase family protein [Lachnospiraceae bacterium]
MKAVTGLIPLYDDEKDSFWMLPGYMKVLEKCGGLPVMLPLTGNEEELKDAFSLCDGILFTGGHDVSPAVYGESIKEYCGTICDTRDKMEGILLNLCLKEDKPFLGICRGIQFINAYLGGSLYQDLPAEYDTKTEHHMTPPYDRAVHKVEVLTGSRLADIIGEGVHEVNSYHHQAIKKLSPMVRKAAVSEDGLTEAIEIPDKKFALAIQWHPEFFYENNPDSIKLIQAFIDACI